jgi:hypothetical protein
MRTMMDGASDSTVRSRRSWTENATSRPDSGFRTERSINGMTGEGSGAGMATVPVVDWDGKVSLSWAERTQGARNKNARITGRREPEFNRV